MSGVSDDYSLGPNRSNLRSGLAKYRGRKKTFLTSVGGDAVPAWPSVEALSL
jgi:hypothetical protein